MKLVICIIGVCFLCQCGIKGDPVPPTKAVNWGKSLKKKKDENK